MIRYTRNGRIHFLRIGRYQFSFVRCNRTLHQESVYLSFCNDVMAIARIMGA